MGWRGIADAVRAETWGVEGSRRVKRLAIGGGLSLTRRLAAVDGTDTSVGGGVALARRLAAGLERGGR